MTEVVGRLLTSCIEASRHRADCRVACMLASAGLGKHHLQHLRVKEANILLDVKKPNQVMQAAVTCTADSTQNVETTDLDSPKASMIDSGGCQSDHQLILVERLLSFMTPLPK